MNAAMMVLNRRHCCFSENGWSMPAAHGMKARGVGNGMEVQGRFNTGCWQSNGCCSIERWFVEMMSWLFVWATF
jgi:hypothetical protein